MCLMYLVKTTWVNICLISFGYSWQFPLSLNQFTHLFDLQISLNTLSNGWTCGLCLKSHNYLELHCVCMAIVRNHNLNLCIVNMGIIGICRSFAHHLKLYVLRQLNRFWANLDCSKMLSVFWFTAFFGIIGHFRHAEQANYILKWLKML